MHFHLPKPLHGWREFAGEVGIIVVGVLIALCAEQMVESWSWQRKADEAQRTINSELGLNAGVFDAESMLAPCRKNQLSELRAIISSARKTGRIGDVKGINGGGSPEIVTAAWDGAVADGTVSHIPDDRRRMYSILYTEIVEYEHQLGEENRLWTHLRLLQHSPGKVSDSMLTDIAGSEGELRYRVALGDVIAEQALVIIRGFGIQPSYGFLTGAPGTLGHGTRADVLRQFQSSGIADPNCAPVLSDGHAVAAGDPQK